MNQVVKEFIVYSLKEISLLKNVKISSYPKVILTQDDNKTETLAYFNPNNSEIVVYTKGRIYADIFRSLSHELVHYVQMLNNELTFNSGDTGTDIENEANSLAGIVLRNYTKLHPDIIKQPYPMIEPTQEIPTLQGICATFVDKHRENSNEGCLMLKLSIPYWENLLQQIDENDLYTNNDSNYIKGLEKEPHVTILYGLSDNIDKLKLINSIKTIKNEIEVKLTEVNLFENEKFDVVKFKVESPTLHKLHSFVKENFENTESYPTYEPHVTIAYVKKGCGQKYVKQLDEPLIYSSKTFKYSDNKDSITFNVSTYLKLNEYSQGIVNKLTKQYKTEFPNLTDEQILYYINRFDQLKSSPKVTEKDILKYKSFRDLEQVVDAFPTKEKVKKDELNNVEFSNTELIYNNSPLQIYHGDSPKSCIKIKGDFPATWCIARSSGGNMYHNYRFGDNEPSFYFVKNLERMNKINELKDDKYCFFVVQIDINGDYIVTSALNDGDEAMNWEKVVQIEPLLNGKEKLFKHNPLQPNERELHDRFKNGIGIDEYKKLSHSEKKQYLAIRGVLSVEEFKMSEYDIKNDYITMGSFFTKEHFDIIRDDKALVGNYKRVLNNNKVKSYITNGFNDFREFDIPLLEQSPSTLFSKKYDKYISLIDKMSNSLNDGSLYNVIKTFGIDEVFKLSKKLSVDTLVRFSRVELFKEFVILEIICLNDNDYISERNVVSKYGKYLSNFLAFSTLGQRDLVGRINIYSNNPPMIKDNDDTNSIMFIILLLLFGSDYIPKQYQEYIKSKLDEDDWSYSPKVIYDEDVDNLIKFIKSLSDIDFNKFVSHLKLNTLTKSDISKIRNDKNELNECQCEEDLEDDEIEGLVEYLKTTKNFINEAEYQGHKVTLNKPMRGDTKKFKVYVKNSKGRVVKVNFGSKDYNIKKNNPNRKKSYCARSKGIEGGGTDKTKANYWSRKMWKC